MAKVAKKTTKSKVKSIMDTYAAMKTTLDEMEDDATKFDSGTNAAGLRVRKAAQELKKLCQSLRGEVTDIKKSRKK